MKSRWRRAGTAAEVVCVAGLCVGGVLVGADRVYETVGRGGLLIHPWIEGLGDEFRDGEHLVFYRYGDLDGLARLIEHWTRPENDAERRRIAAAGQAMVRERCSYVARTREMLDILSEHNGQIAEALG